ncbi:type I-G CRISPR-associated helicase/endonuclease Cas3g [Corynebacterium pelargi]|uniref:Helicase Cas3 n=1 Tax=Corynebacterium pelargi TaxID=1471400 RepID=A0A410W683_9CORY|nr:type I-U CRISPR-associated helicase/endonuclease Cas3 [Corynebacterium pelargi]QAU51453.1 helicase Cas3 [Corynebacterium pelargi]GGG79283.1 hypothetical protein GCM10007338_16940 [Corynebacterium pelargi]
MTSVSAPVLSPDDFHKFFEAVNPGYVPFAWQQRLVDFIVAHGHWPEQVIAPTGTGKSAVVDVHVFVNALAAIGAAPRVPRRLFTVVNRRALVDNQHDRALKIAELLRAAVSGQGPDILVKVAGALASFRTAQANDEAPVPIDVGLLRGGALRDNPTLLDPAACAVVSATPDMWGSRLLFRGYGASWRARPREAAMAAYDSVMVLDESHLNSQLLVTARRIAELAKREADLGVPKLQVVETTATPSTTSEYQVSIEEEDVADDQVLAARLNASKPLTLKPSAHWQAQATGKRSKKQYIGELCDTVLGLLEETNTLESVKPRTVGCIVNRVNTAVDLASMLQKANAELSIKVLVGRMRPADLVQLRREYPALFTVEGDERIDLLIATQALEVGIDVDFAAMVTELASASALAQRFGRVNRLGQRTSAPITVMVPEENPSKDALPYTLTDVVNGLGWLESLEAAGGALSPSALMAHPAPIASRRRALYQRPEWANVHQWSRTGDALFADDDLSLWLRDDLAPEQAHAGIVVREGLPVDDLEAQAVLQAVPPRAMEEFPAKVQTVRLLLEALVEGKAGDNAVARAFIFRDGTYALVRPGGVAPRIRPGDVLIVDYGAKFTKAQVAVDPADADSAPRAVTEGMPVLYANADHRHNVASRSSLQDAPRSRRDFLGLDAEAATVLWRAGAPDRAADTVVLPVATSDDLQAVPWFLVLHEDHLPDDAPVRQQWTPSVKPVTLTDHSHDVAERARRLSTAVGLGAEFEVAVVSAAFHHDDGKADLRFQRMLTDGEALEEPLAKSAGMRLKIAASTSARAGLPVGWRHEQYSVIRAAQQIGDKLVLRLIGTSHGHGRRGFPHVGAELLPPGAAETEARLAEDFFTVGAWDELVERTEIEYGHYAVAFLEALVRAADNQVSKEGH